MSTPGNASACPFLTGFDDHDWEALIYEADSLEAKPAKN
jgi:hypothetical protein